MQTDITQLRLARKTKGPTILLVDDDSTFIRLACATLQARGFHVRKARSLAEAEQGLLPDVKLLIIDGLLPDGNGMDFIAKMKKSGPLIKTIFVSAFWRDRTNYLRLANELHVDSIFRKPLKPEELSAAVVELLGQPDGIADLSEKLEAAQFDYAQLQEQYLSSLPHEIRKLTDNIALAAAGDAGAFQDAKITCHQIHGMAGCFGAFEVGNSAGKIERELLAAAIPRWELVERELQALRSLSGKLDAGDAFEGTAQPHVFLATHNEQLRAQICNWAAKAHVRVTSIASEESLLNQARDLAPDGLLLDEDFLPKNRSLAMLMAMKQDSGSRAVSITFVAEKGDLKQRLSVSRAGSAFYLQKPVSDTSLDDAVRHMSLLRRMLKPKILIVDDDELYFRRIAHMLIAQDYQAVNCSDPTMILEALEVHKPDMLLVDYVMPKVSGIEICKMLRATVQWKNLPVIISTAHPSAEVQVAAFRAGADDYVVKPIQKEELLAKIDARIERARLQAMAANQDSLTGLANRRSAGELLAARHAEAKRLGKSLTVAMMDVDHFKSINDAHGHHVGDRVLVDLGGFMRKRLREEDIRARWGGEEFLVAFFDIEHSVAKSILDRLRLEFSKLVFENSAGKTFSVTFSTGLVTLPAENASVDELIRQADAQLYAAKAQGRNVVMALASDALQKGMATHA